jgi:hypothetical protein
MAAVVHISLFLTFTANHAHDTATDLYCFQWLDMLLVGLCTSSATNNIGVLIHNIRNPTTGITKHDSMSSKESYPMCTTRAYMIHSDDRCLLAASPSQQCYHHTQLHLAVGTHSMQMTRQPAAALGQHAPQACKHAASGGFTQLLQGCKQPQRSAECEDATMPHSSGSSGGMTR